MESLDKNEIPRGNRVKRNYTVSQTAIDQRIQAGKSSKPPNNNNFIHGKYAQTVLRSLPPCRSKCELFEDCEYVLSKETKPGDVCLGQKQLMSDIVAVLEAQAGKFDKLEQSLGITMGKELTIIKNMMSDVIEDGTTIFESKINKDGVEIGQVLKSHPHLPLLPKMLESFGISLKDSVLTKKEKEKSDNMNKNSDNLASLLSNFLNVPDNE